jgi:hypothetical protein
MAATSLVAGSLVVPQISAGVMWRLMMLTVLHQSDTLRIGPPH